MGRRGCGALAALLVALSSCAHAAVQLTGFGATPGPSGAGAATQPKPSSAAPKPAAVPAPDATSDTVGATVASFRVDEGGNATYSIPIQLPPGTAGLVPKLALSYNNRLPNGVMGPGWTIEGASSITRCRQAREHGDFMSGTTPVDGNPPPVDFTSSDRFCLDGVRLLLRSGNPGAYGADGTTYSPENDPTTLVTAHVTTLAAGPASFTVQRKDGTSSTYGNTAASPNATVSATLPATGAAVNVSWNLARAQDSAGNYIDYLYTNHPSGGVFPFGGAAVESVLSQVNYTGHLANPATPPYASVSFGYATLGLGQVRLGYQAGVAFLQSQQLMNVTVASGGTTMRYYALGYGTSTSGSGWPWLTSVQECRDGSRTVCFPPTQFTWSAATTNLVAEGTQTLAGPNYANLVGYKVADVDGDGRLDVVLAIDNDTHCTGTSALYVGFLDQTATHQMTLTTLGQAPVCAPIDLKGNDLAWYLLDYDGDGKADLLIGGAAGSAFAIHPGVGRPAGGAQAFDGTKDLLANLATPITVPAGMNATALLADLNGDGLPDLITPDAAGPINPVTGITQAAYANLSVRLLTRQANGRLGYADPVELVLRFAAGDTTCAPSQKVNCSITFFNATRNGGGLSAVATNDVDGDGRADLTLMLTATPCGITCQQRPDGANVLAFDPTLGRPGGAQGTPGTTTYWYQFTAAGIAPLNSGAAPVQQMQAYARFSAAADNTLPLLIDDMYVVDLNGDGLADLLYKDATDNAGTTYRALINTGSGYLAAISATGIRAPLQFADLNGDGRADIVYPTGASYAYVSVAPSNGAVPWAFGGTTVIGASLPSGGAWTGLFGDFDGDGAADFLAVNQSSSTNFASARPAGNTGSTICTASDNRASCSRYHARDAITTFTNGLGAQTTVVYQPLTNIAVYQRGGTNGYPSLQTNVAFGWNSPVFDVLAPLYVVSRARSSAPVQGDANAQSTVDYRYAGGLIQSGGRGFLGFYETWSFDANDAAIENGRYLVTVNSYGQQYPFLGLPLATFKLVFPGTAITRGSSALDACADNIEDAGGCFAGAGATPWPDLVSNGVIVGYSDQQPACNGPGCTVADTTTCTSTATRPTQIHAVATNGLYTPPASAQPVFAYVYRMTDMQADLGGDKGTAGAAVFSEVDTYSCYDGDASTPSHGNLLYSRTLTYDGISANHANVVAQKLTANTFNDDTGHWFLGRLTQSTVTFVRPGTPDIVRRTDFGYDPTTGLLTSERIQSGGPADQDLRTLYSLDAFGNRIEAWQCSNDLTDSACKSTAGFAQQPSGTQVHRYAKTVYDSQGRYVTASRLPFFGGTDGQGRPILNEQSALTIQSRDEFGNVTAQQSIDGLVETSAYGALGRPYFRGDNTGKATTTTYRPCGSGTGRLCSRDATFVFRSQTVSAGAPTSWTYFDRLGRAVATITQAFDDNPAGQQFTAVCTYYDGHNRPVYRSEPFFLDVPANPNDGNAPTLGATAASPCASASYATTTQYDVLGRVVKITKPDTATIVKSYLGLTTFTTNERGYTWEETRNALGEVIETRDPSVTGDPSVGLIVATTYDAAGDVLTLTRDALNNGVSPSATQIVTTYFYDTLGRKIRQIDPDSGTTRFAYNAAGDLIAQTDAKGQTVTSSYDALGRRWRRTTTAGDDGNALTDTWTYDTAANGYGQLAGEVRTSTTGLSFSRVYTYDAYGRASGRSTSIAGNLYTESTAYDAYGRPQSQQDASGYTLTTNYTARGYVGSLTDSRAGTVYEVLGMTARGQVSSERRGGTNALKTILGFYPATGRINTICSGASCALQDLTYTFDATGTLVSRTRATSTQPTIEQFTNDALNRLTLAQLTKVQGVAQATPITTAALSYDLLGNLCSKNGQTYRYAGPAGCPNHGSTGSPHAATQVGTTTYQFDGNGNQTTSNSGRTLVYNALNQLASAASGTTSTTFQYAPDGDRFLRTDGTPRVWPSDCKSASDRIFCDGFEGGGSSGGVQTTIYIGSVELIRTGSTTEIRRYLAGVAIDYVRSSGANEIRFLFADHLGSLDVVASSTGAPIETASFDVHGSRRDPVTWQGPAPVPTSTTRGYTGHEHVDGAGFIHMNGRLYDPALGRMLQADPLTGPGPQGLNRYSYVANNPLTLTDPSGYSWWSGLFRDVAAIGLVAFAPELWGVAQLSFWQTVATGFLAGTVAGGNLQGGLYGAFSAGLFYGIGQAFDPGGFANSWATRGVQNGNGVFDTSYNLAGFSAKVIAHGIAGGVMSSLEGGRFGNGFLSAGVSEAFAGAIDRLDPANPLGRRVSAERVVAASILGGTTSALVGGKFGNGAITAAFGRAFNEEAAKVRNARYKPTYGATVAIAGNNIAISLNVFYFGPGVSDALIEEFNQGIIDEWNRSIDGQTISLDIRVVNSFDPDAEWVYVPEGNGSPMNENGRAWVAGSFGSWPAATTSGWIAAHEAGHFLGLSDAYTDVDGYSFPNPGMELQNEIMAQPGGHPTLGDIQLLRSRGFSQ